MHNLMFELQNNTPHTATATTTTGTTTTQSIDRHADILKHFGLNSADNLAKNLLFKINRISPSQQRHFYHARIHTTRNTRHFRNTPNPF